MIVATTNKNNPISMSADVYTFPVASENSLAITLAIVFPGLNIPVGKSCVFPISIVTAIVSPNALPRANSKPANKPDFVYGIMIFVITSKRVAPNE